MNLRRLIKNEKGGMLVFAAAAAFGILACAALSIDISYILTSQAELQNAVDAAALAGVTGLTKSQTEAVNRAAATAAKNVCANRPVSINVANITFPSATEIQVTAARSLSLYFGRVLGVATKRINATATASMQSLAGTDEVKPWAVPDFGWLPGQPVTLKPREIQETGHDDNDFYYADFPPINKGAPRDGITEYKDNLKNGSDMTISIGDHVQIDNTCMPCVEYYTYNIIQSLMRLDSRAFWNGSQVVNSNYPGNSSPRIFKIFLYNPNYPPTASAPVTSVTGLGAFFVESVSWDYQTNQFGYVTGRFIEITTTGEAGDPTINSYLVGAKLVL